MERALPDWAIDAFGIRYDHRQRALSFPVEDRVRYRSLHSYDGAKATFDELKKMWWRPFTDAQHQDPTPPFPGWRDWRDQACELIVEGDFDAMAARANGILACAITLGAATFTDDWASALTGQTRVLLYDNDEMGRLGMVGGWTTRPPGGTSHRIEGAAPKLAWAGCRVLIASWPDDRPKGWDATDHFRSGGSAAEIRSIVAAAVPFELPATSPTRPPAVRRSRVLGGMPL